MKPEALYAPHIMLRRMCLHIVYIKTLFNAGDLC